MVCPICVASAIIANAPAIAGIAAASVAATQGQKAIQMKRRGNAAETAKLKATPVKISKIRIKYDENGLE